MSSSLNVWMNGSLVGEWSILRSGTSVLRYSRGWIESPYARALSLSLPITSDGEVRGPVVENYFENLLPDSIEIRRRIRTQFATPTMSAFDLLTEVGRDCVGAVQLLPPETVAMGWDRVDGIPLSETQVGQLLRNITAPALGRRDDDTEDFRISIAGAQEKTALLSMGGKWYRPQGATPTTHILKLPLGLIGGMRADFSDSVENEWLCAQLLRELGLPVATTAMGNFDGQKALIVSRFDRHWVGTEAGAVIKRRFKPPAGAWIARLPQEDFCQAAGLPPSQKYEADGGPSVADALALLAGSEAADHDKAVFVLTQLAFWLLAATDGHAKNFSLHQSSGGHYRMTPLYDVLSAWPIIGPGASQIARQKTKLAMSLRGTRKHYKLDEINTRHWQGLAQRSGVINLWERMIDFTESADAALQRVERKLPDAFPERVFTKIASGVRGQVKRLLATT